MAKITEPGIYDNISMDEYINDPCPEPSVSRGVIEDLIYRSPIHAMTNHPRLGKRKDDDSARADLGSAAHARLFGGKEIVYCDATYASGPRKGQIVTDWTAKDARAFQREARAAGEIPLLQAQREQIETMFDVAQNELGRFGTGRAERTVIWKEGNIWCRCRPDWIPDSEMFVVDYKTADNADPHTWIRRVMLSGGYDIQGTWMARGTAAVLGCSTMDSVFLVQEIEPPYACSWIGIGAAMREVADAKIRRGLEMWGECRMSDMWPSYRPDIHWADLPGWSQYEWEARQIGGESK
jgi:hypothetical protein